MTILSPQTIRSLCRSGDNHAPLIAPFIERKVHKKTGLSGGLSCSGYDVHLADITTVKSPEGGSPFFMPYKRHQPKAANDVISWTIPPQTGVLGVTVERFNIPDNVMMQYFNKSTLARQFIHASATIAEPGWQGWLTLELYNSTDKPITLLQGQPIGQVVFNVLDYASETPYNGKYQNQPYVPIQAQHEKV